MLPPVYKCRLGAAVDVMVDLSFVARDTGSVWCWCQVLLGISTAVVLIVQK
jgi:hypothetical protein